MSSDMQRRPTMREVAGRAGVSFKTVSRVVNGEPGVSPELAARVRQAIDELGYRPDDRARRLRQGGTRTGTIGFVLVDVANPFFSSLLRGIDDVAQEHDCLVLSGSTDGRQHREDQLVEAFVDRRVDGLIVVSAGSIEGPLETELNRGTPVVFVDIEPHGLRGDLVRSDHYGGAVLATEHLIAHGHRDIAFFGDDVDIYSAGLRLAGFREAMETAGLAVEPDRVNCGRYVADVWRTIVLAYLERPSPPTALFTAQNFVTLGAVAALHDLGLHDRIALVGFDEIELADAIEPGVTVVPQHPMDLGRRAAEQIFARIDGSVDDLRYIAPPSIVPRGSGEIRPA